MSAPDPTVPDVAVQIADAAFPDDFTYPGDLVGNIVAALDRAGWLHDPAEVAALRADYRWARDEVARLTAELGRRGGARDGLPGGAS